MIRLPFSNAMLRASPAPGSVDLDLNPWAKGLSALEIFDEVIRNLGRHRIAVIINNHTSFGQWSGGIDRNGIWFDPSGRTIHTEEQWIEDWAMIARRYTRFAHVIGCDLRNEVRPVPGVRCCRPVLFPRFGIGGALDWSAAVQRAVGRVLEERPEGLIVVERLAWPQLNLKAYARNPGPLLPRLQGHLVLAVHHYSWSGPGRWLPYAFMPRALRGALRCVFGACRKPNYGDLGRLELLEQLHGEWGFVVEDNICPVWVSEFGCSEGDPKDLEWFQNFTHALQLLDVDWAYWPLFAEGGNKPDDGGPEWYGTLSESWTPKQAADRRLALLEDTGLAPEPSSQKPPKEDCPKLQAVSPPEHLPELSSPPLGPPSSGGPPELPRSMEYPDSQAGEIPGMTLDP